MESLITTFQYFFQLFLSSVQIAQVTFSVPFCWSENCMSSVFELWNISCRCFSIAIYRKFDLYYLCLFRLFFLVCKLYNSCQQFMPIISDYLQFMARVHIGDFQ